MNRKNNTEKKELLKRGGKMSDGSKEKQNYKVPLLLSGKLEAPIPCSLFYPKKLAEQLF